jgi:hypothetical protein
MIPKKKIIGLSIGRVNGNSEILLKEALMGVIVPLNPPISLWRGGALASLGGQRSVGNGLNPFLTNEYGRLRSEPL